MGGAFIAIADDATAASWNPGGLTQLERPEISLVYAWGFYRERFDSGQEIYNSGADEIDLDSLNYLSVAYPIPWTIGGRNLVLSLNYQRKFDFRRDLDFNFRLFQNAGGFPLLSQGHIEYEQEGSLSALSPAFGFELTDRLSLGMAVNIWDQSLIPSNEWKERVRQNSWVATPILRAGQFEQVSRYEDFDAVNYTFGARYRATERLSIGAVYHTAFSADVRYSQWMSSSMLPISFRIAKHDRRIEFPGAWGLGVAYRFPGDKLTLSLDVTRRNWDRFVEVERGQIFGEPRRTSPITGLPKYQSYHEPTYTVRLGAEYVFFDESQPMRRYLPSLRVGAIYDPAPSGGRKVNWLGLGPVTGEPDDFYGITLGAGLLIGNRVNLDIAYQYRWGRDVRKDTFSVWDVDADVDQHDLYLSTVIYF